MSACLHLYVCMHASMCECVCACNKKHYENRLLLLLLAVTAIDVIPVYIFACYSPFNFSVALIDTTPSGFNICLN